MEYQQRKDTKDTENHNHRGPRKGKEAGSKRASKSKFEFTPIVITCCRCRARLRLGTFLQEGNYRCRRCGTVYEAMTCGVENILFVKPCEQNSSQGQDNGTRAKFDLGAALARFGMDHTASCDQVHQTYRHLVAQYHPDKVAHLAPEFRELAEEKTKELNLMFEIVKKDHLSCRPQ